MALKFNKDLLQLIFFFNVYSILLTCVSACQVWTWHPGRPEEDVDFLGTVVTDGCGLPCFQNPSLYLEERPVA